MTGDENGAGGGGPTREGGLHALRLAICEFW